MMGDLYCIESSKIARMHQALVEFDPDNVGRQGSMSRREVPPTDEQAESVDPRHVSGK